MGNHQHTRRTNNTTSNSRSYYGINNQPINQNYMPNSTSTPYQSYGAGHSHTGMYGGANYGYQNSSYVPRTSDPITNKYFDIADRVTGNVSGSGYRSGNMVNNGSMSNMGYAGNMGTGNMGTVPMGARDRNIDALLQQGIRNTFNLQNSTGLLKTNNGVKTSIIPTSTPYYPQTSSKLSTNIVPPTQNTQPMLQKIKRSDSRSSSSSSQQQSRRISTGVPRQSIITNSRSSMNPVNEQIMPIRTNLISY